MPPQGSYFIELFGEKLSQKQESIDLVSSYFPFSFFVKIDDRGRITLPSVIRRNFGKRFFAFSAMGRKKSIVIRQSDSGYVLDARGRLSLPADIRRSFGLDSGDVLTMKIKFAGGELNER